MTAWLKLQNACASATVVVVACAIYRLAPFAYHRKQFSELYGLSAVQFTGDQFLFSAAALYIAVLALYFACARDVGVSKSLRCLRVVAVFVRRPMAMLRAGLGADDRVAVLTTLLKALFAPMMTMLLLVFCNGAIGSGSQVFANNSLSAGLFALLEGHTFWFFMQVILFIDVVVFTCGYLIELPRLRNRIRSVDPSLLGWTAALMCYPPFNLVSGYVLGSTISDFPVFDNPSVHVVLNTALLVLMTGYASASVAMGWKASNLTHRGIVDRGPYAVVRHPAYVCKNAAWWIGSLPLMGLAFGESVITGVMAVASMTAWSALYVLRALTEEDHLKRVDADYSAYATRVPYRFIPRLV